MPSSYGYYFNPSSSTLWSQKVKNKFGNDVTVTNAAKPGDGANYIGAPSGVGFQGVGPGNLPINPRDAQYFMQTSGARYELQNRLRPLQQRLSELGATYGPRGNQMDMYGVMKDQSKRQWNQGARQAMTSMAQRGVYNSGMRGKTSGDLARQWANTDLGLRQEYGDIARSRLSREIAGQRRDFGREIMVMLLDASRRKSQYETGEFMPGSGE